MKVTKKLQSQRTNRNTKQKLLRIIIYISYSTDEIYLIKETPRLNILTSRLQQHFF